MKTTITTSLLLGSLLPANTVTLESIEVHTAKHHTHSLDETTANLSIVTAQEIEAKGYLSVAQALEHVSGISLARAGGLGQTSSLFVRGSSAGKVLVLIDGMRLNDPSTTDGRALLENLSTTNIAQIEVLKGSASSIWGSAASAGVVNIITKSSKGIGGSLETSYGSYNTSQSALNLHYNTDKLTLNLQGGYTKSDGISALSPKESEEDGYENQNYKFGIAYKLTDSQTLNLTHLQNHNEADYDLFADDDTSTIESVQKLTKLSYGYNTHHGKLSIEASQGSFERTAVDAYGGVSRFVSDLQEYGIYATMYHAKGLLTLGAEHKAFDGFNSYTSASYSPTPADASYTNSALFVTTTYNINEQTLLEANVRYDRFSKFENFTSYKVGVKHTFKQDVFMFANTYNGLDVPSVYQFANAKTTLTPTTTKGYEVGVGYGKYLQLVYFNNKVEDEILYLENAYSNYEESQKLNGLEVESSYSYKGFDLRANYTRLFGFKDAKGENLLRRPKEQLDVSLEKHFEELTFGTSFQYIGTRYDKLFDAKTFKSNTVSTGGYSLVNLHYRQRFSEALSLNVHLKNVLDTKYESVAGYSTEGRTFLAKLRYNF